MYSCRDGRIKIIGGDNIEGLLISPKKLPYKNLEVTELENYSGSGFLFFLCFLIYQLIVF